MRTLAILPVKSFGAAKQRLRDEVGGDDRSELARAMLEDVLAALAQVDELDGVLVVTANPLGEALAGRPGVTVLPDEREDGHSAAALMGIAHAVAERYERVLLVPGDAPLLDPEELRALLTDPDTPPVVIVPDRHGTGTNALLLAPPNAMEPAFGDDSRARHEARAAARGRPAGVVPLSSLVLDVDTPEDLRVVARTLEQRPGGAPATRAVLERLIAAAS